MSSALEYFSQLGHVLVLEDDVIGEDVTCNVCNRVVLPFPAYTCDECRHFYLHKSCAELPTLINHHKHNKHPLALLPRVDDDCCNVCRGDVKFAYACDNCKFNVCVLCAFGQRDLHHEGHKEQTPTLMRKEAFFECDACYEEATDSSYVCTTCEFWIHKSCAISPSTILTPLYHHHPVNLIFSIPDVYR